MKTWRRVLVFGVFDCLHKGHVSFLRQARRFGAELIVAVARDRVARRLKKKRPLQPETMRIRALRTSGFADRVVRGDLRIGTYGVVRRVRPDVLCFGYDQKQLMDDVQKRIREGVLPAVRCIRLRAYRGRALHSSLLQKRERVR